MTRPAAEHALVWRPDGVPGRITRRRGERGEVPPFVIPAHAGIQALSNRVWTPAPRFRGGMLRGGDR
jgi:hypothetical protein